MPSTRRTIEQERAKHAWEDIQAIVAEPEKVKKNYNSLVKKVPALILTNGLCQVLAFLKAKGREGKQDKHGTTQGPDHRDLLLKHLSNGVRDHLPYSQRNLLDAILAEDSSFQRRATRETLAYLQWLKRFADAELPSGEETE